MYQSEKGIPIYINKKVEEIEDMFVYLHFREGKDTNQWKITLGVATRSFTSDQTSLNHMRMFTHAWLQTFFLLGLYVYDQLHLLIHCHVTQLFLACWYSLWVDVSPLEHAEKQLADT